jgi:hypothetical protein
MLRAENRCGLAALALADCEPALNDRPLRLRAKKRPASGGPTRGEAARLGLGGKTSAPRLGDSTGADLFPGGANSSRDLGSFTHCRMTCVGGG